jgi:hypothetical protein
LDLADRPLRGTDFRLLGDNESMPVGL